MAHYRKETEMSLIDTLHAELETLEAVHKVRQDCTRRLAERPWTRINAKLYELSCAIERVTAEDVRRKRAECIRWHLAH